MRMFCAVILLLSFLTWGGTRIVKNIVFGIDCGGHIRRAATANTIPLAEQEMKTVISYLENNNKTNGYTSLVYNTPDEDIGFWYTNLKGSLDELEKVTPNTTQLERSNMLIKLRETLLHHGSQGESVTVPRGISVFPNNWTFAFLGIGSLFMAICGVALISTYGR